MKPDVNAPPQPAHFANAHDKLMGEILNCGPLAAPDWERVARFLCDHLPCDAAYQALLDLRRQREGGR